MIFFLSASLWRKFHFQAKKMIIIFIFVIFFPTCIDSDFVFGSIHSNLQTNQSKIVFEIQSLLLMVIFHGNSPQTLQIHNDFWSFVREFYIVVSCLCAFFSSALLPPQSLRNVPYFILFFFIHASSSFCLCYTTRTYRLFVCCVFPISILDVHYQFTMSSVFQCWNIFHCTLA